MGWGRPIQDFWVWVREIRVSCVSVLTHSLARAKLVGVCSLMCTLVGEKTCFCGSVCARDGGEIGGPLGVGVWVLDKVTERREAAPPGKGLEERKVSRRARCWADPGKGSRRPGAGRQGDC